MWPLRLAAMRLRPSNSTKPRPLAGSLAEPHKAVSPAVAMAGCLRAELTADLR